MFRIRAADVKREFEYWSRFSEELIPLVEAGLEDAANYLLEVVRTPPDQKDDLHLRGTAVPFKTVPGGAYSQRQYEYILWALRTGEMAYPYPRTNDLENSWHVIPVAREGTRIMSGVETELAYAPWVQSARAQAGIFAVAAPYWQTDVDVITLHGDEAFQKFKARLDTGLDAGAARSVS